MVHEVVSGLNVSKFAPLNTQATFIDATVGFGGHAIELVKRGLFVLGIDADVDALEIAEKNLAKACPASDRNNRKLFKLVHGNFRNIDSIAKENDLDGVSGILIDLGVNTHQLTSEKRGFSFTNKEAPLDMRLDRNGQKVTAADLLNSLRKEQLRGLFSPFLDYHSAKKLTEEIINARKLATIATVGDFLIIADKVLRREKSRKGKANIRPETIAFMALRIAVNSELENLKEVLPKAFDLLGKGGRLVVISFHSEEDSLVKRFFKRMAIDKRAKIVSKKPIVPTREEIEANVSSRSAKMRILEKI